MLYGVEIDTAVMELLLPEDKLTKATLLVNRTTNRCKVTLRDLLSVIYTKLNYFVALNHEARADLSAWQEFSVSFNGKSMFLEQQFLSSNTIKLYTDASIEIGFAVVFEEKQVAGRRHRPFTSADITLLELCPLLLAAELFGKLLANHCIIFMPDRLNK